MGDTESLGSRIRRLRRELGLSQEQLAEGIVSMSYVSLIESGARVPSTKALTAIAAKLGTTTTFLLSDTARSDAQMGLRLRNAELALRTGDAKQAQDQAAEILVSDHLSPSIRTEALATLGQAHEAQGNLAAAIEAFEEVLAAADGAFTPVSWMRTAVALSRCCRESGDLDRAIDVGERAAARAEALGVADTDADIELRSTLAFGYIERGDFSRAQRLLEAALQSADRSGSNRSRGAALWNLSHIADQRGDVSLAYEMATRALFLFVESDDQRNIARLRNHLAGILLKGDPPEPERAEALLTAARNELSTVGTVVDVAYCDTELARARLQLGDPTAAIEYARSALMALDSDYLESARALLVSAQAWHELGDTGAAGQSRRMAIEALDRAGASRQAAEAWTELAHQQEEVGDFPAALASFRQATEVMGLAKRAKVDQTITV